MDEIMGLVRPAIVRMIPYSAARAEGRPIAMRVRLDSNESPYPPFPEGDGQPELNRYPEGQPEHLLDIFADFYGVPRDWLLFTRGVEEAIDLLVRAFCTEGRDAVLQTPPTFRMYRHSAQVQGVDVVDVPLTPHAFQLDVPSVLAAHAARPRTKILFFCSPNNPTANLLNGDDILRIANVLFGQAIVVVDEVYLDYSDAESLANAIARQPNIVVLGSMSKGYSLAGERFGITIAHPCVINALDRIRAPYPLTQTAIRAVTRVMTAEGLIHAKANIAAVLEERARVAQALTACPAVTNVFPSDANFLLVQVDDARALVDAMKGCEIKICDQSALPGIENCLRISIGTPEENNAMLSALEEAALEAEIQRVQSAVRQTAVVDGEAFDLRGGLYRLAHLIAPDARRQELSHVRRWLQPQAGEIAVDIAAGSGFLTLALASWTGGRVYAVDTSDFQLTTLRSRVGGLPIRTILGSLADSATVAAFGDDQGRLDCATSLGGLHHVIDSVNGQPPRNNQRLLFEGVDRLLRPGGRFIGVDVGGGTQLAEHFDHSVARYCVTGHQGKWLTAERLATELSEGTGLRLLRAQIIPVGMRFASVMQMALFMKALHAYDLPIQRVIADLDEALGFAEVDGQVVLNWPLLFFHMVKAA
jgi:histidinol-phosphate aminotransferase